MRQCSIEFTAFWRRGEDVTASDMDSNQWHAGLSGEDGQAICYAWGEQQLAP
jgi:hypothetical protein